MLVMTRWIDFFTSFEGHVTKVNSLSFLNRNPAHNMVFGENQTPHPLAFYVFFI